MCDMRRTFEKVEVEVKQREQQAFHMFTIHSLPYIVTSHTKIMMMIIKLNLISVTYYYFLLLFMIK